MNYREPELIDRLAAEYVLGTLHGKARRRFDRLMVDRDDIRRAVWRWEGRFGELTSGIEPVQPPARVWQQIMARIDPNEQPATGFWRNLLVWRSLSAVAGVAAVILAILLVQVQEPPIYEPGADHVALVGESSEPLWVIAADLETGLLSARAINAQAAELDKVFELWMLPEEGPPQSIGLLPVSGGQVEHELPAGLLALLKKSKGLAISIEPPGGSPTGLPTGPVVHTAKIFEL